MIHLQRFKIKKPLIYLIGTEKEETHLIPCVLNNAEFKRRQKKNKTLLRLS
jgi:hypothetical protein